MIVFIHFLWGKFGGFLFIPEDFVGFMLVGEVYEEDYAKWRIF